EFQLQIAKIGAIIPKGKPLWVEVKKIDNLNDAVSSLRKIIEDSVCVTADIYKKLKTSKQESYPEQIKLIAKLEIQQSIDALKINTRTEQVIDNATIELSTASYSKYIEELKVKFIFDVNKSKNESNFYKAYFDENNDTFTAVTLEAIEHKVLYISEQLNLVKETTCEQYLEMQNKVKNIITKTEQLKRIYDSEIKKYKLDMANKIKLPFFIYTAKILQNYQQGMGIFLTAKGNSSIRFLTDADSDHDAIHHLSSGQLAVVSLAFCLAINKTYNISKDLKFLAIDDPIQEMDALNIHSFIELVRHELVDDYQLIFSTHNDASALFMKYKIEKMHSNSVKMIDVQSKFFS
ncbi:MAG: hypothetical protein V7735_19990, partial [Photobacterium frigidiphilum]|uniref:hypothetical protein n=1 Tax=Photobacterium frigidiphilum TaxID=264736 RepID=UPI003002F58F